MLGFAIQPVLFTKIIHGNFYQIWRELDFSQLLQTWMTIISGLLEEDGVNICANYIHMCLIDASSRVATNHYDDLDLFTFLFSNRMLLDKWKLRFWIKYILTILRSFWSISASVSSNFSKMKTDPSHPDDELQLKTRHQ